MSDLVEWLTSILDEDEAVANAAAEEASSPRWDPGDEYSSGVFNDVVGDQHHVVSGDYGYLDATIRNFVAAHDPAWVVADIAAKRAIIALLWAAEDMAKHTTGVVAVDAMHEGRLDVATAAVRRLASAYADRPGYDESWRP